MKTSYGLKLLTKTTSNISPSFLCCPQTISSTELHQKIQRKQNKKKTKKDKKIYAPHISYYTFNIRVFSVFYSVFGVLPPPKIQIICEMQQKVVYSRIVLQLVCGGAYISVCLTLEWDNTGNSFFFRRYLRRCMYFVFFFCNQPIHRSHILYTFGRTPPTTTFRMHTKR